MATKDQLFANRFFKAEAFKKPLVVEIDHCVVEPLKNNEGITKEKLVIFFTDQKQQLVCNSSNFDSIADVTGEMDTDMWAGHKICLYLTMTQLGNKRVPAIRVKAPPAAASKAAPQPKAPPADEIPEDVLDQMLKEHDERSADIET
jgi:hypothetical protein